MDDDATQNVSRGVSLQEGVFIPGSRGMFVILVPSISSIDEPGNLALVTSSPPDHVLAKYNPEEGARKKGEERRWYGCSVPESNKVILCVLCHTPLRGELLAG